MKKLFKWIFILAVIWINMFTIDYVLVYNINKPLFYWNHDYIKTECGDVSYLGFGYMFTVDIGINDEYKCAETGRFKVCPLFTECLFD